MNNYRIGAQRAQQRYQLSSAYKSSTGKKKTSHQKIPGQRRTDRKFTEQQCDDKTKLITILFCTIVVGAIIVPMLPAMTKNTQPLRTANNQIHNESTPEVSGNTPFTAPPTYATRPILPPEAFIHTFIQELAPKDTAMDLGFLDIQNQSTNSEVTKDKNFKVLYLTTKHLKNSRPPIKGGREEAFLQPVAKAYAIEKKIISSADDFCQIMETASQKYESLAAVALNAHANPLWIALNEPSIFEQIYCKVAALLESTSFFKLQCKTNSANILNLQTNLSCLKKLKENITFILDACSTGEDGENKVNIANHFYNNLPTGSRLFAAKTAMSARRVKSLQPLTIELGNRNFMSEEFTDSTYEINPNNKELLCANKSFSPLFFCHDPALLKDNHYYNAKEDVWEPINYSDIELLQKRELKPLHLQRISERGITWRKLISHLTTLAEGVKIDERELEQLLSS